MPFVQDLINNNSNWLTILVEQYKIDVTQATAHNGRQLVSLRYNQIDSPMTNPIVQECRGMVVELGTPWRPSWQLKFARWTSLIAVAICLIGNSVELWRHNWLMSLADAVMAGVMIIIWAVVEQALRRGLDASKARILAFPYSKFWNSTDALADKIDWETARIQEKLDGSLMLLHYYDNKWCVASSGHPTAGGSFGTSSSETFNQAFWRIFKEKKMLLPDARLQNTTFMLELCAMENRIVVRHDKPTLIVHGSRNLTTGRELTRDDLDGIALAHNWELVKEYPLTTLEECIEAADARDPIQHEGFIVVDAHNHRIKIKSKRYVILHHMKGQATPRRAIALWQTGEAGELLSHFPEMAPLITPIHELLDLLAVKVLVSVVENKTAVEGTDPKQAKKEFAAKVKGLKWSGVVFHLYNDKEPTLEKSKAIMRKQTRAALERLVDDTADLHPTAKALLASDPVELLNEVA